MQTQGNSDLLLKVSEERDSYTYVATDEDLYSSLTTVRDILLMRKEGSNLIINSEASADDPIDFQEIWLKES